MNFPWRTHQVPLALLALLVVLSSAHCAAPEAITAVQTSTQSGSSTVRSVNGTNPATTTWTGTRTQVDSITVGGQAYVAGVEGQVLVRRNSATSTFPNTNANQVSTWTYRLSDDEGSPPNVSVYGEYHNSFNPFLTQNNLSLGIENAFANTGVGEFSLNVERIDYIFDDPVTVSVDQLLGIFERGGGGSGSNNGFGIALITGISGTDPTAYSDPFFTADTVFSGSPALLASQQYDLYKYDVDGGPELDFRQEQTAQHLVGVSIPTIDLVSAGTTIYGYSLFAQDVTATTGSQLVDHDNSTYFPTNTNSADGDMDLAAVGARFYTLPVPEPSGWILWAAASSLLARRRRSGLC